MKKIINKFNTMETKTKLIMDAQDILGFEERIKDIIPMISHVPPLRERFNEEKEEFIYYFFKEEAKRMNSNIYVNTSVIKRLMNGMYNNNINGLYNAIKIICAN